MHLKQAAFGDRYKDIATGFRGVATAVTDYWDGRRIVLLEGTVTATGEVSERWVSVDRLEPISNDESGQYA